MKQVGDQPVLWLGRTVVLSVEVKAGRFQERPYFFIEDVKRSTTTLEILSVSREEREWAAATVKRILAEGGSPFEMIREEARSRFSIRHHRELDIAFDFAIYQAFSTGEQIKGASGRLHSVLSGPSSIGKGMIRDVIEFVSPVFEEAQASKVTVAGLIGSYVEGISGYNSDPGLLPLSHHGALVIQDFHGLRFRGREEGRVFDALSKVMQDGEVYDSTRLKRRYDAHVGLHLDLNEVGDLGLKTARSPAESLGLARNILSRSDLLLRIGRDAASTADVTLGIYDDEEPYKGGAGGGMTTRQIHLLVAYLRELGPDCSPIRDQLREYHQQVIEENVLVAELNDFHPRLAVSMWKMAAAICRAHGKERADKEVFAEVRRFVECKLRFLKRLFDDIVVPKAPLAPSVELRIRFYVDNFGGKSVKREIIHGAYCRANPQAEVSIRTVTNDLKELGAKSDPEKYGHWRIPAGFSWGGEVRAENLSKAA